MPVKPTPAHERVLARVVKAENGCWLWQGARNHSGYGIVQMGRGIGTARTHRVVYEAMVGPIPKGLHIDHLCHTPACVNPAHLEPVTLRENTLRQWRDGRGNAGAIHKAKTHCIEWIGLRLKFALLREAGIEWDETRHRGPVA